MTQPAATFGFKDVDPAEKPRLVRGVFDRVDALLFVLPATYYLVRALNIG